MTNIVADRTVLITTGSPSPDGLGIGDLVRVIMMAPILGASRIAWCSPASLFALVKDCTVIDEIHPLDELPDLIAAFDVVINLGATPMAQTGVINLIDLLDGDGPLKARTFHMVEVVFARLGVPPAPPRAVASADPAATAVGFNFRLPPAWAIKAMPMENWQDLADSISPHWPVTWQPDESGLADYIAWIKGCRIVVSSVGLGCHLAMLYGLPLVVLSGPTDFAEVHDYPQARVLYPFTPCSYRPCHQPQGVDSCGGCMQSFRSGDIVSAMVDLIGETVLFAAEGHPDPKASPEERSNP